MPTVAVEKDVLMEHLGKCYSDKEFDELCFEFGIELDDITSERLDAQKSVEGGTGTTTTTSALSKQQLDLLSDKVLYKIDVPANRYDLLCVEGLSRALQIFLGIIDAPIYTISPVVDKIEEMIVYKKHTDTIRPYIVCAILKGIDFTNTYRYKSFLDLQDQLHRNLCRQRTLVAIGTHDYDTISGPFIYTAQEPSKINFIPLTPDDKGSFNGRSLIEHYETDIHCKHLKPYVSIIKDSPLYPVLYDSNNVVLSLPPLINGSISKITSQTKNVFIECTATDITKANIVLDTMVTMFCQYCTPNSYTVEPVCVKYVDNVDSTTVLDSYITPVLSTRTEQATVDFCNSLIGINITANTMKELCNKVQLGPAVLLENDTILQVTVPPTRSDILHPVDIAEDIGIAYGFNNIVKQIPKTSTVGKEQPINHVTDLLRDEISRAGYIEVLTHGLCSLDDNYTSLQIKQPDTTNPVAVSLSNPANIEYQIIRTTLLPGLLKTLQHNRSVSFTNGFKLFEISDVVVIDTNYTMTETIVGTKNIRKICAVYSGPTSGFEIIHGLVDRIMTLLEITPATEYIANSSKADEEKFRITRNNGSWVYTIQELTSDASSGASSSSDQYSMYFPQRAASVILTKPRSNDTNAETKTITVGTFGILHPKVLFNFDINYPASCMELDLEEIM